MMVLIVSVPGISLLFTSTFGFCSVFDFITTLNSLPRYKNKLFCKNISHDKRKHNFRHSVI